RSSSLSLLLKLDIQLALKEHIQDLRGRANKWLQLVKRLASTSWGADKNTLRQLYIGYHTKYTVNKRTQLIEETSKKHGDPIDIMITAQKTLDTYPEHWIHVYTDGSAFKGTINGGYGSEFNIQTRPKKNSVNPVGHTAQTMRQKHLP
ncbi:hypothetical protein ElyMa_000924000, partial [Elysia marginata]